jgi:hypothetical protein
VLASNEGPWHPPRGRLDSSKLAWKINPKVCARVRVSSGPSWAAGPANLRLCCPLPSADRLDCEVAQAQHRVFLSIGPGVRANVRRRVCVAACVGRISSPHHSPPGHVLGINAPALAGRNFRQAWELAGQRQKTHCVAWLQPAARPAQLRMRTPSTHAMPLTLACLRTACAAGRQSEKKKMRNGA